MPHKTIHRVSARQRPEVTRSTQQLIAEIHRGIFLTLDLLSKFVMHDVKMEEYQMQELEDLKREVSESRTVNGAVKKLLTGLSAKIAELANASGSAQSIKAELSALSQDLNAQQQELTEAVTEHTPAEGHGDQPGGGGSTGGVGGGGPSTGGVAPVVD